nr:MAG TPA: hypothetical protein [Caudoviricetes sp.]
MGRSVFRSCAISQPSHGLRLLSGLLGRLAGIPSMMSISSGSSRTFFAGISIFVPPSWLFFTIMLYHGGMQK